VEAAGSEEGEGMSEPDQTTLKNHETHKTRKGREKSGNSELKETSVFCVFRVFRDSPADKIITTKRGMRGIFRITTL
jgi:hypothetical protein